MKVVILLIAFLLLGLVYGIFFSQVFKIKSLTFSEDQLSCTTTNEVGEMLKIVGENFWLLDSLKTEKKIKDKYLCIRSVILGKSFPDKINLSLKNRRAVLTLVPAVLPESTPIQSESTESAKPKQIGEALLVDDEGVVFDFDLGQSNQPSVYILNEDLSIGIGKRLDLKLVQNITQVLDKLRSLSINTDDPKINSQNNLSIGGKPQIFFALDNQIGRQLASLQLILDQAKIETNEVETLDLRFDKPVVKYGKRQSDMRN